MHVLARGIEDARNVTIEGPEGRDPRELDRATIFSRASYQLRRGQDGRHAAFGCGDGIDEMHEASRRDASVTPPGISIGSAKRLSRTRRNSATEPGFKRKGSGWFRHKKAPDDARGFER